MIESSFVPIQEGILENKEFNSLDLSKELRRDHGYIKKWVKKQNIKFITTFYHYNKKDIELLTFTEEIYNKLKEAYPITKKEPKWSIDKIKQYLKENKPHIELLSTEYKRTKDDLKWKCIIHDEEWEVSFDSLKGSSVGCSICAKNKQYTWEETIKQIEELDLVYILDDNNPNDFTNSESQIHVQCKKDNYIWWGYAYDLVKGKGCNRCSKREVYTFAEVKRKIEEKGTIKVISSEKDYVNVRTNIKLKCTVDDHEWENTPDNIFRGRGCYICGLKKRKRYNKTLAERHKDEWIKTPCSLYIIHCYDDKEAFFKIGLTNQPIKYRFSGNNLPYNYDVLHLSDTNTYEAVLLEDYLQHYYEDYSYKPSKDFGGKTECFSTLPPIDNIKQQIKEYMKEKK